MRINLFSRIALVLFVLMQLPLSAQLSCPSKLNAHLKPVWSEGPLSWGTEVRVGGGLLGERFIQDDMLFGGLEYSSKNLSLYAEGGAKYWSLWEDGAQLDNFRLGMRELYIKPRIGKSEIKAGLQSLQFEDQFLINERAIALSFKRSNQGINVEGAVGTVSEQFARNGSFSSKRFLYDVVPERKKPFIAEHPFDENFAAFVISLNPSERKKENRNTETNSVEELAQSNNPVKSPEKQSWLNSLMSVDSYGALAYSEFGKFNPNPRFWIGVYETITLPFKIKFKGEYLYQQETDNRGVVLINSFFGEFSSPGALTEWNASYYYFIGIDKMSGPSLSYTNLFLGEVIRLDEVEVPLASAFVKHHFLKQRMSLKLQYAASFSADLSEVDLQLNKKFGKNFFLNATLGYLDGTELKNPFLGRVEMRFVF